MIGAVIQARTRSTRLPNKITKVFYHGKTILDIIIETVKKSKVDKVIIATSSIAEDRTLGNYAIQHNIDFFQGPEDDVLERFVLAAKEYQLTEIIRICSDNPFLFSKGIDRLIDFFVRKRKNSFDYISYKFANNVPAIKTHFGFYTELISLDALLKVKKETEDRIYHEHVTNYIYENGSKFRLHFIKADTEVFDRKDIRLTVDSDVDFKIAQELYALLNAKISIKRICSLLNQRPDLIQNMLNQINQNVK